MTNIDPVMETIFTKMIPCPGVGILKMIPCSAARPRTEKYMSTPPRGFETLLTRSGSFCIHARNLQKLMTEIYKSMNQLNPSLVWEFHEKKHVTYDLRIKNLCKLPQIKTQGYGQESLSFRGSFLWNTLDDTIKNQPTLTAFKKRIKDWAGDKCTCKICR